MSNDVEKLYIKQTQAQGVTNTESAESVDTFDVSQPKDYIQENVERVPEQEMTDFDDIDANLDDIFAELDKTDIDFDEVLEKDFRDDGEQGDGRHPVGQQLIAPVHQIAEDAGKKLDHG